MYKERLLQKSDLEHEINTLKISIKHTKTDTENVNKNNVKTYADLTSLTTQNERLELESKILQREIGKQNFVLKFVYRKTANRNTKPIRRLHSAYQKSKRPQADL